MSGHLLEMAKALVRVKDGKIEVLTDPLISCCSLCQELYGIEKEGCKTVERVLQSHMQNIGMYEPQWILKLQEKPVSFGVSEILIDTMTKGLVDSVVVVYADAGTVVVTRPDVLQAAGGPYDLPRSDRADCRGARRGWRKGIASSSTGR